MTVKWIGISKLQEEMGELQTVLAKLQAYPDGQHPDMAYSKPLLDRLHEELSDVCAAVIFFTEINSKDIDHDKVTARTDMKIARYIDWHHAGDHMTGVTLPETEEK